LDAQYLEIGNARKELFAWDISDDKGCEIELERYRCDEMVDWSVNEPPLLPQVPPIQFKWSFNDINSGWGWGDGYNQHYV
jgi:hypothetical protein